MRLFAEGEAQAVLVTGAATGIGLATAGVLAANGWRVLGTGQPGQDASALSAAGAETIEVDLTDESSRADLIGRVLAARRLDALVSNAGVSIPGPIEGLTAGDYRATFELNAIVPMLLARAVLPRLRMTGGRMVFVGAGQGRVAIPFGGPYGASKAALASLTDALRAEVAAMGVSVSLVEPGAVRTGILTDSTASAMRLLERMPADVAKRYRDPLVAILAQSEKAFERALEPDKLARLILRILTGPRPRPRYLIGREAVALAVLSGLPARWRAPLVSRLARPKD